MRNGPRLFFGLISICLFAWFCGPGPAWEGKYVTSDRSKSGAAVALILEAGGKGRWVIDQEASILRWEERSDSLWLHFKTGGVLIARPDPSHQTLTVEIPGAAPVLLRKVP